jgi:hypothetical protein
MRKIHTVRHLLASCLILSGSLVYGTDYYVNNVTGKDTLDGKSAEVNGTSGPLKTVNKAISFTKPGDTIHMANTGKLYRQSIQFSGKGGTEGKPITVDGHGATISGAEICPAEGWKEYKDGILTRDDMSTAVFMMIDGKMVFGRYARDAITPGEFCYEEKTLYFYPPQEDKNFLKTAAIEVEIKGAKTKLETKWSQCHSKIPQVRRYRGIERPEKIYVNGKEAPIIVAKERLKPGMWCTENYIYGYPPKSALYYMPPQGKNIKDLKIECIIRQNGVGMQGKFSYVIIKNMNAIHVGNDGYNIHGEVTKVEFYNCNAKECGDEGFSAHDKCGTLLDGAVYENCDNGIANVNNEGYSITKNVILANSRHVGFLLQSPKTAWHQLENAIIVNNPSQFGVADLKADNVLIVTTAGTSKYSGGIGCGRNVELKRVTVFGNKGQALRLSKGSSLKFDNGLFWGNNRIFHFRYDNPAELIKFKNIVTGPEITVEWGSKYPWKKLKLAEWFAKMQTEGSAENCKVDSKLTQEVTGTIDKSALQENGCSKELIDKYNKYIESKK